MDNNQTDNQVLDYNNLLLENQQLKEQLKMYEGIYNRFDFEGSQEFELKEHLKVLGNTKIDILLRFLNRMKYNLAESSLRECKTLESIHYRDGAFRQIELLQLVLLDSKTKNTFDNKITGEKGLAI